MHPQKYLLSLGTGSVVHNSGELLGLWTALKIVVCCSLGLATEKE